MSRIDISITNLASAAGLITIFAEHLQMNASDVFWCYQEV